MKSLWNDAQATEFGDDPLGIRVYTSRLLGADSALVLHGGGNTSVKAADRNVFGDEEQLLYIKGSGWDLATIERAGFAPVRLDVLQRLADVDAISDSTLVRVQRSALFDPRAPDPSVEAVLHAIIPFAFVDHTHADAVVALTNTPTGARDVATVYGDRVLVIPYVMPGFPLAKLVRERTRNIDWSRFDGMILLSHGVFSWGRTGRESYEAMLRLVTQAEDFLDKRGARKAVRRATPRPADLARLSAVRKAISRVAGKPMLVSLDATEEACGFSSLPGLADVAGRGPLTPDHIIRTKRIPMIIGDDPDRDVDAYADSYQQYFRRCATDQHVMLDRAPRWGVWPGHGVLSFGPNRRDVGIVGDIVSHTAAAIQWSEASGGWRALPEKDLFDVEYWELEQAKLGKAGGKLFDGRVALVTGGARGIGRAIAIELAALGAAVISVDLQMPEAKSPDGVVDTQADLTHPDTPSRVVAEAVRRFGGLDILVSNAGILPSSTPIERMDASLWDKTIEVNLTSHQRLWTAAIPYLKNGIAPSIVVMASKNVPAPGPAQAAYSVSKAGLTQLARVAALELAPFGIRVNMLHPNAVFDTGFWSEKVLAERAAAYNMTVEEYRRSNLLGVEINSKKVAALVVALAGPAFSCTTGAQIPIDGGNDRVI